MNFEMDPYVQLKPESNCLVCDAIVRYKLVPVCRDCIKNERAELMKARRFVENNPDMEADEVAEKTNIPKKVILWYIENGKLGKSAKIGGENKGLTLEGSLYGEYIWIDIRGKIDSYNADDLKQYIDWLIKNGWKKVILDMQGVTFFSSTGIRIVVSAYKQLNWDGGSFHIANPSKNVANVLGMVALDTLLFK